MRNQESETSLPEGKKKKKNTLWGNIRARRSAGKPRLKPGQKGYPKTLNIESALKELILLLVQEEIKK
jgi:hypothetical protein